MIIGENKLTVKVMFPEKEVMGKYYDISIDAFVECLHLQQRMFMFGLDKNWSPFFQSRVVQGKKK